MLRIKISWVLGVIFLVAVTAVSISCTPTQTEPAADAGQPLVGNHNELLQQANAAYDAGAFELAAQLAQQAIQIAPDDSRPWELYEQAVLAN
ncbi:MAG: hypothetical protein ACE5EY_04460, partial [Anaerolineae bacterium]